MIWIILATIAVTGLLLLKHEGGSITEEPIVTAVYLVWPFVLVLIMCVMLWEARKAARDLTEDIAQEIRELEKQPTPKDLN